MTFRGELNDQLHGFYRSTYTDDDGDPHDRDDAVRGGRCPARLPVLGRARPESGLRCHPRRARRRRGAVERTGDRARACRRRPAHGCGSPTPCRCRPTSSPSWSVVSRSPSRSTSTACRLRVVHLPGKGHLARFALEAGEFSLRFFTDYYGIPYPDRKVDFVAMPDFAQGAMENTGLITYRESLLLVDPGARDPARAREHRRRGRPRAGAPVVRQPRHDALVERHLAERSVRHVHGAAHGRRLASRLGALDLVRPVQHLGEGGRRAALHPGDRVSGALARRRIGHVRRADLSEGRGHPAHARAATSAPSGSATASGCTSAAMPTATPRRTTSGTRSRNRAANRSAASWTSGSGRAGIRCSPLVRRRRRWHRDRAAPLRRRRRQRSRGVGRAAACARARRRRVVGARAGRRCGGAGARRRRRRRERRGEQLRPGAVRGRSARTAHRPARRSSRPSSGTASSTTIGPRSPLGRRRPRSSWRPRRATSDDDDLAVWQSLMHGLGWCDRFLEGEHARAAARVRAQARGAGDGPPRLGSRRRRARSHRGRCAVPCCKVSACSAPIRTPRPPPVSSRPRRARASRSTRRSPQPR